MTGTPCWPGAPDHLDRGGVVGRNVLDLERHVVGAQVLLSAVAPWSGLGRVDGDGSGHRSSTLACRRDHGTARRFDWTGDHAIGDGDGVRSAAELGNPFGMRPSWPSRPSPIIFCISSNCLRSCLTSWIEVPLPLAMRRRAAAADDLGVAPLVGRHRVDDRLDPLVVVVGDLRLGLPQLARRDRGSSPGAG